jgi:polyphenol oxidase
MILTPDWPLFAGQIGAFTTCRTGGVSVTPYDDGSGAGGLNLADHVGDQIDCVWRNRALLRKNLPNEPQWLTQIHSSTVLNLDEAPTGLVADACITSKKEVICAVLTADCLPVLFCDAKNSVVGAAHAGWRGLADGVLEKTVMAMQNSGADPGQIYAWLGPAIGPSKFEVGAEVRARFVDDDNDAAAAFVGSINTEKFYADLYRLARIRLQRAGLRRISGGQHCTYSEPEKFYSYRRDGVTGRMASLIWMK